jgi:hypothetical protein
LHAVVAQVGKPLPDKRVGRGAQQLRQIVVDADQHPFGRQLAHQEHGFHGGDAVERGVVLRVPARLAESVSGRSFVQSLACNALAAGRRPPATRLVALPTRECLAHHGCLCLCARLRNSAQGRRQDPAIGRDLKISID